MLKSVQFQKLVNRVGSPVNDDLGSAILLKKVKIGRFIRSLKSNIFAVGKYDTRRREVFGTTHAYKFISFNTDVRIDPVQLTIGNVNGK